MRLLGKRQPRSRPVQAAADLASQNTGDSGKKVQYQALASTEKHELSTRHIAVAALILSIVAIVVTIVR